MQSAQSIIDALSLEPHPEGGYFRETFRDELQIGGRATSTAIYYLLEKDRCSHWHRVDAAEIWHYYAGAPLVLSVQLTDETHAYQLGSDLSAGQQPQYIVPPNCWQSAKSLGDWTLVGCTVAPGFEFDNFELAPDNWEPI